MSILYREDLPFARIYGTVEVGLLAKYSSKQPEPKFSNLLRSVGIEESIPSLKNKYDNPI
jgi:hypothetical protein